MRSLSPPLLLAIIGLIWDRAPCHMSKAVDQFLEEHADRLVVGIIPGKWLRFLFQFFFNFNF